jgi:predicted HD superfamily hydrolase involved in NAD metabolism
VTPSWETALAALGERLDERGVRHSTGVAAMAERLARTYGLDVDSARLAGLLHDWCKDVSGEELLGRAEALGIPVTDADRAVPYLLHAPVAARELKDALPGIDGEVLDAIAAHTYGSSTLTPLDMAVYVADTLEPGRTHAGVEELRALIGSVSLDELFALAYADSLRHLVDSRRRIHPETVATWNRIVGGEGR